MKLYHSINLYLYLKSLCTWLIATSNSSLARNRDAVCGKQWSSGLWSLHQISKDLRGSSTLGAYHEVFRPNTCLYSTPMQKTQTSLKRRLNLYVYLYIYTYTFVIYNYNIYIYVCVFFLRSIKAQSLEITSLSCLSRLAPSSIPS